MKRRKTPRGYLLMEAMLGAALLAVVLAATFATLAQARVTVTRASQRVMAAELAQQKMHELSSRDGPEEGSDTSGVFQRTWRVTSLTLPETPAASSWLISVNVSYRGSERMQSITHEAIRRSRPLRL